MKAKPSSRTLRRRLTVSGTVAPTMKSRAIISMFLRRVPPTSFMATRPPSPMPLMPHFRTDGMPSPREKYSRMCRPSDGPVVRYGSTSMNRNNWILNSSLCMQASMTLPVHQLLLNTDGVSSPMASKNAWPRAWMAASSVSLFILGVSSARNESRDLLPATPPAVQASIACLKAFATLLQYAKRSGRPDQIQRASAPGRSPSCSGKVALSAWSAPWAVARADLTAPGSRGRRRRR